MRIILIYKRILIGGYIMSSNKVEICGVNTSKLPLLTNKENLSNN